MIENLKAPDAVLKNNLDQHLNAFLTSDTPRDIPLNLMRWDLSNTNLEYSFLRGANMRHANAIDTGFYASNLINADLSGSDCSRAGFGCARMAYIHLHGSKLHRVDLKKADCRGAIMDYVLMTRSVLTDADFTKANLAQSDIQSTLADRAKLDFTDCSNAWFMGSHFNNGTFIKADMRGCDLRNSSFRGANFGSADLRGALLEGCDMTGAKLDTAIFDPGVLDSIIESHRIVPLGVEFYGWTTINDNLVKLKIPPEASRIGGLSGSLCRATKAVVSKIYTSTGQAINGPIWSGQTIYETGREIESDLFCNVPIVKSNPKEEITFYMTQKEAIDNSGYQKDDFQKSALDMEETV